MGIPPTNEDVSFSGINIHRFDQDKLSESQVAWDLFGLTAPRHDGTNAES